MRLSEIARIVGGEVVGDGAFDVRDVAEYAAAGPQALSCADTPERLGAPTAAGALIVPPGADPGRPGIRCAHPRLAFARAIELLRPAPPRLSGIHPSASIDPGARLGEGVCVGALASISAGAEVGDRCQVGAGARIGEGAALGADCVLHPNCVLYSGVRLGDRVVIHAGTVIGADGFGYVPGEDGRLFKFPQRGTVVIEDDVEIGANAAIDRAALGETRIGRGTKIDNLVQVGHNVTVGEDCAFASQVGISGSVRIGRRVMMGGQAGIADHVSIGDDARLAAQTGVTKSLEGGKTYLDAPAAEAGEARRRLAAYRRLPEVLRRIGRLEEMLRELGKP
ncbi:MAG: UDP-3-O-(3-hydroxymyristoyl)glucosamine N-acyltransferase [Candidatus Tectomicrobia bacterium RIFCSPLOWO2_12_FULL_69_37]|nr:MAG: UDP-3-O-(3-hydroxymyristoyl)glucosamine N-acyltransferase [Candidatus Tectomicrobia bacterium RIFCSPLOWO2_02_FULL_70_19]OGL63546.1 MAG: UDP-3-O-(3-hydroxymyristoyl)glucosamine N-acyltransferase [Candidatus Tectomicrobia bacterium RIFCSPLOWO2_12_FULL_69_37]